ncbi:hypothetical protein P8452_59524 [Trifolium repens]|nr:hypothetical protein P8452_59524 [Trifolium repens]
MYKIWLRRKTFIVPPHHPSYDSGHPSCSQTAGAGRTITVHSFLFSLASRTSHLSVSLAQEPIFKIRTEPLNCLRQLWI